MQSDHWFYGLFQSAPDLITLLLPSATQPFASLDPDAPGDRLYRFEAPELKAVAHRLDGVLWPRLAEAGSPSQPVVLLELQMHSKPGFLHRLGAQCFRFLQLHPHVRHLAVVVGVPHGRLRLAPASLPQQLQWFSDQVLWLNLEQLARQPDLDPLVHLLTLPVLPAADLGSRARQILDRRPDLLSAVLPMLIERLPTLSREDIMRIAGIPSSNLRHTRAAQEWIEEGRQEGEAAFCLRLLNRRCGPLSETTTAQIQALPLLHLEALAETLLDFSGPADLSAWLQQHTGRTV